MLIPAFENIGPRSYRIPFVDNQPQAEEMPEQTPSTAHASSDYVFLNNDSEESGSQSMKETTAVSAVNGEDSLDMNGQVEEERQPQNGAEAYENLVKSLTECDTEADYMKEINEDEARMDENFGLIDEGNILETFGFTRESGLFQ